MDYDDDDDEQANSDVMLPCLPIYLGLHLLKNCLSILFGHSTLLCPMIWSQNYASPFQFNHI